MDISLYLLQCFHVCALKASKHGGRNKSRIEKANCISVVAFTRSNSSCSSDLKAFAYCYVPASFLFWRSNYCSQGYVLCSRYQYPPRPVSNLAFHDRFLRKNILHYSKVSFPFRIMLYKLKVFPRASTYLCAQYLYSYYSRVQCYYSLIRMHSYQGSDRSKFVPRFGPIRYDKIFGTPKPRISCRTADCLS